MIGCGIIRPTTLRNSLLPTAPLGKVAPHLRAFLAVLSSHTEIMASVPTGEWLDIDVKELAEAEKDLIYSSGHSHVYKYKNRYAVKHVANKPELDMMQLAGDCSITPCGRIFKKGHQVGIIMELGKPIDITCLDLQEKRTLATKLIALVDSLHAKGLLHGDIRLAHVLVAQDGNIRFCDFGGSQRELTSTAPESQTLNWISPFRLRNLDLPLRKEDDLYALGLTIWELYTGKIPFEGLSEDKVEERIMADECVDISEIGDSDMRKTVEMYLARGNAG